MRIYVVVYRDVVDVVVVAVDLVLLIPGGLLI